MTKPECDLLPDDVDALKTIIAHLHGTHTDALKAREVEIERLRGQIRLLLAQRFGAKNERVSEDSPQLGLFNEAEVAAETAADDDAQPVTPVAGHTRRRGHRRHGSHCQA